MMQMTSCINLNVRNIKGNGVYQEQDRGRMDFNVVDTRGAIDVIIADVQDATIKISGDENLIDSIQTYVENGVLKVYFKNNLNYSSAIGLKVTVPNNGKIKEIKTSGSSNIIAEGTIVTDNFNIKSSGSSSFRGSIKADRCHFRLSGSSDFNGNIEVEVIEVDCSGSSRFNLKGKADVCKISASGSCNFKGYDLTVNKLDCSTSGSSNIQITCNEEIKVSASGASNIYYRGDAKVVSKHTSGASGIYNQ